MDSAFGECTALHLRDTRLAENANDLLTILSSLLANSAQPSPSDLKTLSRRHASGDRFKSCCLRAITSAGNPFIPGMTLSIRLAEAAKQATEGEQRTIVDIQSSVDELLLEIFERLPRTVRGFEGGMDGCTEVFEPVLRGTFDESKGLRRGPLEMIISEPQQLKMFIKVPLVMDFLSSKFTLGLPDLNDTGGLLKNPDQLEYLANGRTGGEEDGLVLQGPVGKLLQAADADIPSLSLFPGAQFIVAGVVAKPNNYYRVPAMRMALDFVVYLGMVAALSYFVLFHSTPPPDGVVPEDGDFVDRDFSWGEGACAMIFILVIEADILEFRRTSSRYRLMLLVCKTSLGPRF